MQSLGERNHQRLPWFVEYQVSPIFHALMYPLVPPLQHLPWSIKWTSCI
jgi:hypothetical protein